MNSLADVPICGVGEDRSDEAEVTLVVDTLNEHVEHGTGLAGCDDDGGGGGGTELGLTKSSCSVLITVAVV